MNKETVAVMEPAGGKEAPRDGAFASPRDETTARDGRRPSAAAAPVMGGIGRAFVRDTRGNLLLMAIPRAGALAPVLALGILWGCASPPLAPLDVDIAVPGGTALRIGSPVVVTARVVNVSKDGRAAALPGGENVIFWSVREGETDPLRESAIPEPLADEAARDLEAGEVLDRAFLLPLVTRRADQVRLIAEYRDGENHPVFAGESVTLDVGGEVEFRRDERGLLSQPEAERLVYELALANNLAPETPESVLVRMKKSGRLAWWVRLPDAGGRAFLVDPYFCRVLTETRPPSEGECEPAPPYPGKAEFTGTDGQQP